MRKRLSRTQQVQAITTGMCDITRRSPVTEPKLPRPTSLKPLESGLVTVHYDPKLSGTFSLGPKRTVTTYLYDSQGNKLDKVGK